MDRIDEKPDEQLVGMLDDPTEWLIHCVGLKAVSAYSLREALVEGHRIAATAHVTTSRAFKSSHPVQCFLASMQMLIIAPRSP